MPGDNPTLDETLSTVEAAADFSTDVQIAEATANQPADETTSADANEVTDAAVEEPPPPLPPPPVPFPPEDMPAALPGWELRSAPDALRLEYWNAALRLWMFVHPRDRMFRNASNVELPRCVLYRGFADGTVLDDRIIARGDDFESVASSFTEADERAWICERWARRLGRSWRHDQAASRYDFSTVDRAAYAADMKRLKTISSDPYRDVRLAWWAIPEAQRPVEAHQE